MKEMEVELLQYHKSNAALDLMIGKAAETTRFCCCDNSMREEDWRFRKRGTQATCTPARSPWLVTAPRQALSRMLTNCNMKLLPSLVNKSIKMTSMYSFH